MQRSEQRALFLAGVLAFCVFSNLRVLIQIRNRHNAEVARHTPTYFAICAVVKNQNEDLREWVQYHQWVGAQRIWLYDHSSSPPAADVLADYVASGFVDITTFAGHHTVPPRGIFTATAQGYAYGQCLERARGKVQWMAFIDVDEFLMLYTPPHRNMSAFLQRYEGYGGVAVNWRTFGSSGHICRPRGPALRAFTACLPGEHINKHIKTIAHVPHTASIGGTPHGFVYRPGHYAVTPAFRKCNLARCSPVSMDRLVLHHYVLKSFQQYLGKLNRGGGAGSVKSVHHFHAVDKLATDTCRFAVNISAAALPGPEWDVAPRPGAERATGIDGEPRDGPPCGLTPGDVRRITYQSRLAPLGTLLPPPWSGASPSPLSLRANNTAARAAPAAACPGGMCANATDTAGGTAAGNGSTSTAANSSTTGTATSAEEAAQQDIKAALAAGTIPPVTGGNLSIDGGSGVASGSGSGSSGVGSGSGSSGDGASNVSSGDAMVALERALKAAGDGGGMWASVKLTLSELQPLEGAAGAASAAGEAPSGGGSTSTGGEQGRLLAGRSDRQLVSEGAAADTSDGAGRTRGSVERTSGSVHRSSSSARGTGGSIGRTRSQPRVHRARRQRGRQGAAGGLRVRS